MFNSSFQLSILLVSYNQEKTIDQAMKSIYSQKIQGPIELIVADDRSTDSTLSIIKQYEGLDSRFIHEYLYADANLGASKNYQRAFNACKGKYIAILEGDDYWSHADKLQRQIDFLDKYLHCYGCSVNRYLYDVSDCTFTIRAPIGLHESFLTSHDLIKDNLVSNFSTVMYRRDNIQRLPKEIFDIPGYDWTTNIYLGMTGLMGYIHEPMTIYRIHPQGIWSGMSSLDKLKKHLSLLKPTDQLTDYHFHRQFNALADNLTASIESISAKERVSFRG